jgi:uncharacterized protein YciI
MFVVTLKFGPNKDRAPALMAAHNAWITEGFESGVFLLTGSLQPKVGGAVIAHNITREELEARMQADPFVGEGVVVPDIIEIAPGRTDERLAFLAA